MRALFVAISLISFALHSQVKVMTYNIRLDLASDGENRWDNRKDMLASQILFYQPDFMGVQEALPNQMQFLADKLTGYNYIGEGRDGNGSGEYSAIFYNKLKYKLVQQKTFWLSPTPDVPSKGWDAAYNRICTYGLFENIRTKKRIWVFNTHFDHVGELARIESTKLIINRINAVNTKNYPVILTGDFNLEDSAESIKLLSAQLHDSRLHALQKHGPEGTFNAFKFDKLVITRIDYIFTSPNVIVNKYAVLIDSDHCRYPSDHLPVYTELDIK